MQVQYAYIQWVEKTVLIKLNPDSPVGHKYLPTVRIWEHSVENRVHVFKKELTQWNERKIWMKQ